ncbi:MAG TPA: hypothetical protein VHO47_02285 [Candidatus Babeliales bacterium]|nr:hypothetical protein [Candidatus Babeliales bacterium]
MTFRFTQRTAIFLSFIIAIPSFAENGMSEKLALSFLTISLASCIYGEYNFRKAKKIAHLKIANNNLLINLYNQKIMLRAQSDQTGQSLLGSIPHRRRNLKDEGAKLRPQYANFNQRRRTCLGIAITTLIPGAALLVPPIYKSLTLRCRLG